jgi:hypothetical protein
VAASGRNNNNYQLLKTSRVTATGIVVDTLIDTTTATDSETTTATTT